MTTERWFVIERIGFNKYVDHPDQPEDGFDGPSAAMFWLADKGLIVSVTDSDNEHHWRGWGDPWFVQRRER